MKKIVYMIAMAMVLGSTIIHTIPTLEETKNALRDGNHNCMLFTGGESAQLFDQLNTEEQAKICSCQNTWKNANHTETFKISAPYRKDGYALRLKSVSDYPKYEPISKKCDVYQQGK